MDESGDMMIMHDDNGQLLYTTMIEYYLRRPWPIEATNNIN